MSRLAEYLETIGPELINTARLFGMESSVGALTENPTAETSGLRMIPEEREGEYRITFTDGMDTVTRRTPIPEEQEGELRIWIRYRGTQELRIDSASVFIGEEEYRFLDLYEQEMAAVKKDGIYAQDVAIRMGGNAINARCFAYLLSFGTLWAQEMAEKGTAALPDVRLVLHGQEDVELTLPESFWNGISVFVPFVLAGGNGPFLTRGPGTPCLMQEAGAP